MNSKIDEEGSAEAGEIPSMRPRLPYWRLLGHREDPGKKEDDKKKGAPTKREPPTLAEPLSNGAPDPSHTSVTKSSRLLSRIPGPKEFISGIKWREIRGGCRMINLPHFTKILRELMPTYQGTPLEDMCREFLRGYDALAAIVKFNDRREPLEVMGRGNRQLKMSEPQEFHSFCQVRMANGIYALPESCFEAYEVSRRAIRRKAQRETGNKYTKPPP